MAARKIIHVDMDAFYASVDRNIEVARLLSRRQAPLACARAWRLSEAKQR